jgi:hypothetical protein
LLAPGFRWRPGGRGGMTLAGTAPPTFNAYRYDVVFEHSVISSFDFVYFAFRPPPDDCVTRVKGKAVCARLRAPLDLVFSRRA